MLLFLNRLPCETCSCFCFTGGFLGFKNKINLRVLSAFVYPVKPDPAIVSLGRFWLFLNHHNTEHCRKEQLIVTPTEIKQRLIKHADSFFSSAPVLFAYLYGSYAMDQVHPFSDLDIAIYLGSSLTPRDTMRLEMNLSLEIDKMFPGGPLSDVRSINHMPLTVAGKVVTDGALIYCIGDNQRVDYETRVRRSYFDFLPFIHNYQRMYFEQIEVSRT